MTITDKILGLFRAPTEAEILSYQLDMMEFERDSYFEAFTREIVANAANELRQNAHYR